MPEKQMWKCTQCGKSFSVGEWICGDGVSNHKTEAKEYRTVNGLPYDPSSKSSYRDARTVVCNIPPGRWSREGTETRYLGEGSVEFIRGRFSTGDPEQQYWLDKRPEYNVSEDQWKAAWLTQNQRLELREMDVRAREERLESDQNELLAKVKKGTIPTHA